MKFSLILATKGRTSEVGEFLESIRSQGEDLEIVIIDQNEDNRLDKIVKSYKGPGELIYLKSRPGLSRARNVGLMKARGEIIAFPDDDCKYLPDTLSKVDEFLSHRDEIDGVSGRTVDHKGLSSAGKFSKSESEISRSNIWSSHNSVSLFLRSKLVKKIGYFDEMMGLGTFFSSSEETDYVIRSLKSGFRIFYNPKIRVYHPQVDEGDISHLKNRGLSYGRGVGRLLKKHINFFGFNDYLKVFIGPIIKIVIEPHLKRKSFYWYIWLGRVQGFLKS